MSNRQPIRASRGAATRKLVRTGSPRRFEQGGIGERGTGEAMIVAEGSATQTLVDALHEPVLVLGPAFVVKHANDAFASMFEADRRDVIGTPLFEIADGAWDVLEFRTLLERVARERVTETHHRVEHQFGHLGRRVLLINARPLTRSLRPDIVLAFKDVTALEDASADLIVRYEEHSARAETASPYAAELRHQFRNAIALVEIVALRTLLDCRSFEQFQAALAGRLRALSRAHGRLLADRREPLALRRLIEECLSIARVDMDRIELDGPACELAQKHALPLSLVLHELSTNAARHGALRSAQGRVSIEWCVEPVQDGRCVAITWRESGGPRVAEPTHRGYGIELIESLCAHDLGGDVSCRFAATGFVCYMSIPLPACHD